MFTLQWLSLPELLAIRRLVAQMQYAKNVMVPDHALAYQNIQEIHTLVVDQSAF
jgi:hypothetical protein